MTDFSISPWNEDEYISYLSSERRLYAWCMINYGKLSEEDAQCVANAFYTYEPSSEPYRGLVFHEEAWHWAMLRIFGASYWISSPELETPSVDYMIFSEAIDRV
jgi:hypothetical protein